MSSTDLTSLRTEISGIKQEKVILQTKVTELKGALKSSILHLKVSHRPARSFML